MFNSAPKQHSHLLLKLLLRKTFLNLATIEHSVALDLFAGSGEISSRLYLDFEEIHLVEKDPKRFAGLKEKFSHLEKAHLWQMNNMDFLIEFDITLIIFLIIVFYLEYRRSKKWFGIVNVQTTKSIK